MNRFTVTVITLNEAHNLPRALASIAEVADEIVVVDSGSTDGTCEVAHQHGARVLTRPFTDYSDQKNYAAAQAAHNWIFSLDADEELNAELEASLRRWKESEPRAVAYRMRRRAHYLGDWIRHSGWYPDPKLRLYRRDRARWVGALHEKLEVEGTTEWLEGELLHYTVSTLDEHARSVRRYTTLAARQLYEQGRRRWLLPLLVASPWAFVRTLVFRLGILDGHRGFLIAVMAAYYVFLKYRKLGLLVRGRALEPEGARS